jgi:hypothetical protein
MARARKPAAQIPASALATDVDKLDLSPLRRLAGSLLRSAEDYQRMAEATGYSTLLAARWLDLTVWALRVEHELTRVGIGFPTATAPVRAVAGRSETMLPLLDLRNWLMEMRRGIGGWAEVAAGEWLVDFDRHEGLMPDIGERLRALRLAVGAIRPPTPPGGEGPRDENEEGKGGSPLQFRDGACFWRGARVEVTGKPLEVLRCLASKKENRATKDELWRKLWPDDGDDPDSPHALAQHINSANKALQAALRAAGINARRPLRGEGRGKHLTYSLKLNED